MVEPLLQMGKPANYSSFADAHRQFREKNSKLIYIDAKEGKITSRAPTTKDKVCWTCAVCNKEQTNKVESIKLKNKDYDNYRCESCFRGKNYYTFVAELKAEGWEMASGPLEYENTKSKMNILCPNNHQTKFNYNVWQSEKRVCKECYREGRTHQIEDIIVEFKQKGLTLLETVWKNSYEPMECICSCGRLRMLTYANLKRSAGSCNGCTRRNKYEKIEALIEESGCILLSAGDPRPEFILNATKVYFVCHCGNKHTTSYKSFRKGVRCPECTKLMMKETVRNIFGCNNVSQSEEVKKKARQTMCEHFGVDHHMKLKEFTTRAKETNMKNNGGVHNLSLQINKDKNSAANMEKYGATRYIYSAAGKKWLKETLGVEHYMQNPEIMHKARMNSYRAKLYTFPSGNMVKVQGYEPFALNDLLRSGIKEDDIVVETNKIPVIIYELNGGEHFYYPDIYIKSLDMLIEVKSTYTYLMDLEKNTEKFWASARVHKFQMWVYNKKGERIDVQEHIIHYELEYK